MLGIKNNRGFTLIELLVVITIIGILATGSVAVYTSQIQKARDTNRMNDMKAIQSGVEQFYQDNSFYPDAGGTAGGKTFSGITVYVPKLPRDPKSGQLCNKGSLAAATACDYIYNVSPDSNLIINGEYKISIGLESDANVSSKADNGKDLGTEANRFEIGLGIDHTGTQAKPTTCDRGAAVATTGFTSGTAVSGAGLCSANAGAQAIFVAGNN